MPQLDFHGEEARCAIWAARRPSDPYVLASRAARFRTGGAALGSCRVEKARLTVHRAKGSVDSTHPLSGDELRELRALRRTQEPGCRFIFMNERKAPVTAAGFRKMLSTVGAACGLPQVHPHMLRHSCGFYMADRHEDVRVVQDWLGHANVQNTVRYTTLAPGRLDNARAPG